MNPKLTPERLKRRALVYVRQSSVGQVVHNRESQRRQYGLVDRARELGFQDIAVIDDDLGRSGSGLVERPGFQRLVGEVCTGEVGAVFSIEASRLARNGRDWHHLIELCGMVGAVVIDHDGIYDPCIINDRLLLGLKGTMSEFELSLLRQRSLEAIRQKAARGELRFILPVGYLWSLNGKIETDPDRRIQRALRLVFSKMTELGSARQVLLWFRRKRLCLPAKVFDEQGGRTIWKLPVYHSVLAILNNPVYAGAYAFGKTEAKTAVVDGRARKTKGHKKSMSEWIVLIKDHHEGYISWNEHERNLELIAANTHMKSRMPKAGRGGRGLLSGILRCRRCGRMLHVSYTGLHGRVLRYHCKGAHINHGEDWCISFGGLRVDQAIAEEVLHAISGNAIEAAFEAAAGKAKQRADERQAFLSEIEQAQYEVRLATRRYEAADPENRLVTAELESRWNAALQKLRDLENKLGKYDSDMKLDNVPDKQILLSLAQDLPAVWNSPTSDMKLKQRIVRILIREIVADVDDAKQEIVLLIHWTGGRHSELHIKKNATGRHGRCTKLEAIEVIRRMAGKYPDEQIAATLNRLGLRTGPGNTWSEMRVYSARHYYKLPAYDAKLANGSAVTLEEAARRLAVSQPMVRRLIKDEVISAQQVVPRAPWEIPVDNLDSEAVRRAIQKITEGTYSKQRQGMNQRLLFSSDEQEHSVKE
jgi:DNA invertase Pin-like site-specific DNA recombinase